MGQAAEHLHSSIRDPEQLKKWGWWSKKAADVATALIDWEADESVYELGVSSFETYKRFPHTPQRASTYHEWATVSWRLYDVGGASHMSVDFYLWVRGKTDLRPPTIYLNANR